MSYHEATARLERAALELGVLRKEAAEEYVRLVLAGTSTYLAQKQVDIEFAEKLTVAEALVALAEDFLRRTP